MMKTKMIRAFTDSAGVLLLAAATAMFLANWAGTGLVQPHDPVLGITMRNLFWILGAVGMVVALVCLFGRYAGLKVSLVLWLAVVLVVYRLCLTGDNRSPGVYLANVAATFGLSFHAAYLLLQIVVLYLLIGSGVLAVGLWLGSATKGYMKTACASCGGHIKFSIQNAGQKIPCPHCKAVITLHGTGNLKMSCFFCHGHIEFPTHAIGEKMPCPHCNMDITLMEPS